MVITGLAVKEALDKLNFNGETEEMFRMATKSVAKIILPVIRGLGKLDEI